MYRTLTTATALSAALLVTTAAGVTAQSDESPSEMFFTGVVSFEGVDFEREGEAVEGTLPGFACPTTGEPPFVTVNDRLEGIEITASDPRLSGAVEESNTEVYCFSEERGPIASMFLTTWRITNDGGTWVGTGPGFVANELDWEDPRSFVRTTVLTGTGDYEGLTAVLLRQRDADAIEPGHRVSGVIVPGALPPASDFDGSLDAIAALTQGDG